MPRLRIVLDANVAAAALVRPQGPSVTQLRRDDIEWIAPEYLFDELARHEGELAARAGCTLRAWRVRVMRFRQRVRVVGPARVRRLAGNAIVRRAIEVDPKDAPYLATVVAARADLLWTRDQRLLVAFSDLAVVSPPHPV